MGDQYNICNGNVTTNLPSESLQVMTDVHLYVDGLVPITYRRPNQFEEGDWFIPNNFNCIVGDDKGATMGHVCRILGQFSNITKRAEEQFFAYNKSKKVINVTRHFIIEFSFNLSIHI